MFLVTERTARSLFCLGELDITSSTPRFETVDFNFGRNKTSII